MTKMPSTSTTITISELQRIRDGLNSTESANFAERQRRAELHEKSLGQTQTWQNTLEGYRRRKEEGRASRIHKLEDERLKLDEEEEQFQLAEKLGQLARAKNVINSQSEKEKALKSAVMASEVLQIRKNQIAVKQLLKGLEVERERQYTEQEAVDLAEYKVKIAQEKIVTTERMKLMKENLDQQVAQHRRRHEREVKAAALEGKEMKRKANEDVQKMKEKEVSRRRAARDTLMETQEANNYLKQMATEEVEKQKQEDAQREQFAKHKEEFAARIRDHRSAIQEKTLKKREEMMEVQSIVLVALREEEEKRLSRTVEEVRYRSDQCAEEKKLGLQKQQKDINDLTERQLAAKRKQREDEKQKEKQMMDNWKIANAKMDQMELMEKENRKVEAKNLKKIHHAQNEFKALRAAEEKRKCDTVNLKQCTAQTNQHDQFCEFAKEAIRNASQKGMNIVPLVKTLKTNLKRQ